jgi:hypothetical protein
MLDESKVGGWLRKRRAGRGGAGDDCYEQATSRVNLQKAGIDSITFADGEEKTRRRLIIRRGRLSRAVM